jgi:hypothetical protein
MEPDTIASEMLERGVRPDLLPPNAHLTVPGFAQLVEQGARSLETDPLATGKTLRLWRIPDAWAERTAAFDALLIEFLSPEDHANLRWLRLSPRYLGPPARRIRSLACSEETAKAIEQRIFAEDSNVSQNL